MRSIVWVALGAILAAALASALAGLVALGSATGAFAQAYGMYGYGGKGSYYQPTARTPRARRYYYRGDTRPRTCGQFRYWRDGRCVDARTTPPDLK